LQQLAQKALGKKTTSCSENATQIGNAPKLKQKFPEVVVRFFECQVDGVVFSIYPKAEVIRDFPERVFLVAVDGKGTKNPEDFFLLSSQGELIGFIFKLPNNLFLGLYLRKTKAGSESHQSQLSLILLTFSRQQENKKTKSLHSCSFENLSALLNLACESFGVKLKRYDPGMCFCLIDQLRGQATNLSLSVISRNQETRLARARMPLKEREINNASLNSLSTLADLLRISCDVLGQLSQSSQENSGVLQHSSLELATNNPSWKGQTKKPKDKHRAKFVAGSRQTKPKKIEHLIDEIRQLSAQVVDLLKQCQMVQKS